MGNETGCGDAKHAYRTGFVSGGGSECSAPGATANTFAPKRSSAKRGRCRAKARPLHFAPTESRRIGRQAPVKRCLARFAGQRAIRPHAQKIETALAVGKHLLDAGDVCFVDQRQLLELAHAAGGFGTHQMALAGVPALDFAIRRELEALPGAAVGLQFQFWFRSVSRHCSNSSPEIRWRHRRGRTEVRPYIIPE